MRILVVSASMRGGSQSLKVAQWLGEHASSLGLDGSVLDLHAYALPMFDDDQTPTDKKAELRALMARMDAYVFVSPEWNGMMSHGLINMLHYIGKEMAYKPVMLVGVSSGRGGTHPVDQMKQLGQKNRHYIISPENLIVSGVEQVFNDRDMSEQAADYPLKARADYSLKVLAELAKSLEQVRQSGVLDFEQFKNGV